MFRTFLLTSLGGQRQWPTSHRETENRNWHVVKTVNDQSLKASSSPGEQRNLTVSEQLVQKCEINQESGQRHSPKQHRSKRLKNGRDYSRLWSVLPAEGRLCWHFCSCWLCEDHKGDLGRCWTARATWINWSSKHKATAEHFAQGQAAGPSRYCRPWFRHGTSTSAYIWIKMPLPQDPRLI